MSSLRRFASACLSVLFAPEPAEEIIIFDSTGTALQDVVAAATVYEKALSLGRGTLVDFAK